MGNDTWRAMAARAQAQNRPYAMTCVDLTCSDCAERFFWSHLNRLTPQGVAAHAPKRCPDCWLEHTRAYMRDYERTKRARRAPGRRGRHGEGEREGHATEHKRALGYVLRGHLEPAAAVLAALDPAARAQLRRALHELVRLCDLVEAQVAAPGAARRAGGTDDADVG